MNSCLMPMAMAAPKKIAGEVIKKAIATPAEMKWRAIDLESLSTFQLLI